MRFAKTTAFVAFRLVTTSCGESEPSNGVDGQALAGDVQVEPKRVAEPLTAADSGVPNPPVGGAGVEGVAAADGSEPTATADVAAVTPPVVKDLLHER